MNIKKDLDIFMSLKLFKSFNHIINIRDIINAISYKLKYTK